MIEIVVNGEKKSIEKNLNIRQMIDILGYKESSFAVALNGTFVSIKAYEKTEIKNSDIIDILAPMVGG